METITEVLQDAARRFPDTPALTAHRGLRLRTWTYDDLWGASNGVAHHLRERRRLMAGTPIVLQEENSPELVVALFGTMLARLVVVPIDPSSTPDFVSRVVAATDAGLVVSSPGSAAVGDVATVTLDELLAEGRGEPLPDAPGPRDLAEIVFTSGTTGSPKGVMLTHRNIVSNVTAALGLIPSGPINLVSLLPLSHMFEQTVGLYGPLVLGSTIEYPASRRSPIILKSMRRCAVSSMIAVPLFLELMLEGIEQEVRSRGAERMWRAAHRLAPLLSMRMRRLLFRSVHKRFGGSLTRLMCGGARLSPELAATWERMGVRVIEGYGATECSPIVAANTYWDRSFGTVGRPLSGVEVSISPAGEVLVRGPNVFSGYWRDPAKTAGVIDARAWYHTGDLGSIDDTGKLRITGRLSDRIVLASGLNVYPKDVEEELAREAAIADCVVVSKPDAVGNPQLWAVVIPADGGSAKSLDTIEEAIHRASARLAPHQHVTRFSLWPDSEFPRTNLMKVKRFEVAAVIGLESTSEPPQDTVPPDGSADGLLRLRLLIAEIAHSDLDGVQASSSLEMDVGLDSLAMLELAVRLEDEFGLTVEDGDLAKLETVDAVAELITGTAAPPPPLDVPEWRPSQLLQAVRLVLQHVLLFPLHSLIARPLRVEGRANLDHIEGPVLIVANHDSHLDTPTILRALPSRIRTRIAVAAAADYFYRSRWLGAVATAVLGTFPFSRQGAVRSSLERCGELADDGWSVLIYPEGTRSVSGEMARFRGGIGLLATGLELPVVPVGLTGTFALWPKGARRPKAGPITVRFGDPMTIVSDDDPVEVVARLEEAVSALLNKTQAAPAVGQPA